MRRSLRHRLTLLLSLSLTVATASPVAANWLSDLFQPAAYEELETPDEAADEIPAPVLDGSDLDSLSSDSVLLNPPLPGQEDWTAPYETLMPGDVPSEYGDAPEYSELPPEYAAEMIDESYSAASPGWGGALAAKACCDRPAILYWNHSLLAAARCRTECDQTSELVLSVPRDCCTVEVPVCVPACCSSTPAYEVDRDWLGRVTHHFCWPCGHEVRIVQLHLGSWVVHTYNR